MNTKTTPETTKHRRTVRRLHCANCGDNMILSPGDGKYCQNCLHAFERCARD